jgi:surface antigen
MLGGVVFGLPVSADRLSDVQAEIEKVKAQIAAYEAEIKRLSGQAATLANEIAKLRAEEGQLEAEIKLSQEEHDKLVAEIEATEKRIADNSEMIGYIIAEYYYNDDISLLERLASSRDLAEFVDEEANLSNMGDSLSGIVKENKVLKDELEGKKAEVKATIEKMNGQRAVLAEKRAEQQRLLAETRGEESAFNGMRTAANAERQKLEAEQQRILAEIAAANGGSGVVAGSANKGAYPIYLQNVRGLGAQGIRYSCPQNMDATWDDWGMYICECVSYTAWRVKNAYGNMPYWGGRGNAKDWLANASRDGVPWGSTPEVGSVGIWKSGSYGHAMWVEVVSGDRVYVSQYNYTNNGQIPKGSYSEMWVNKSAFDGFIYFGKWKR